VGSKLAGAMLDIETLGLGNDAVVLEVSIVPYDTDICAIRELSEKIRLSVEQQIDTLGRRIDFGTIRFWLTQNQETVSEVILSPDRLPVKEGLDKLSAIIATLNQKYKHDGGQGVFPLYSLGSFDFNLIENLYRQTYPGNRKCLPYHYRQPHDLRTLREVVCKLRPDIKSDITAIYDSVGPKKHCSLTDCFAQVGILKLIMEYLRGQKPSSG